MSGFGIIIPARRDSTRFPNKPMAKIAGQTLIERTWRVAKAAPGVGQVMVATDCKQIAKHIEGLGGDVWMSNVAYASGSERVAAAAKQLDEGMEVVINLQGDAPLTPPVVLGDTATWLLEREGAAGTQNAADGYQSIDHLVEKLASEATPLDNVRNEGAQIVTAAVGLDEAGYRELVARKQQGGSSGTTVVVDAAQKALYFSRAVIPAHRHPQTSGFWALRHVGLYGFRRAALGPLMTLPPTPLEAVEGLEQLRWLEHGWPVYVGIVNLQGRTLWSVDYPQDIEMVENIIAREGELIEAL